MENKKYKVSKEYDGNTRKLYSCNCKFCEKEFWLPEKEITENNFCTKECYFLFRRKNGKRVDIKCVQCNKIFTRWKRFIDKVLSNRHFCSRECQRIASIEHNKNKRELRGEKFYENCICCLLPLTNRGVNRKYCSHSCRNKFKSSERIKKWKSGEISGNSAGEGIPVWLRKYIFEKYENKCMMCEWSQIHPITGKIPLQVDHIDGNHKNNNEENLRLLCPNCHSLTPTFGFLNKGRGREKKKK
jgi:hypothetical protein